MLEGATEEEIVEAIEATWPGAKSAALLRAAGARFLEAGKHDPVAVLGFCFEATRDLYRKSRDIGDYATALRALKQLADLVRK